MGQADMSIRVASGVQLDYSIKVVDSRPARSAGRVKKKVASKPLKMFVCVTKGLHYHRRS